MTVRVDSRRTFVIRNVYSGLIVPLKGSSGPLTFRTSAEAWDWINRGDANPQHFAVEEMVTA